ncbi:MAG: tetratricopeptide repeat protein [Myxococcota bacterium]|nr:tetratricopeptide repeat protein [Myxococcota bacterium]
MSTGVEELMARAKELVAERRYQDAVKACRRVLLAHPDDVQVRLLLGQALLALGRHEEVRAEMTAVLRAREDATALRLLAEAYLRAGQTDRARDALERARAISPDDTAVRELLGEVAAESAPPSATIDRWFDPEAVATIQMDAPAFEEEDQTGPVPRIDVGGGVASHAAALHGDGIARSSSVGPEPPQRSDDSTASRSGGGEPAVGRGSVPVAAPNGSSPGPADADRGARSGWQAPRAGASVAPPPPGTSPPRAPAPETPRPSSRPPPPLLAAPPTAGPRRSRPPLALGVGGHVAMASGPSQGLSMRMAVARRPEDLPSLVSAVDESDTAAQRPTARRVRRAASVPPHEATAELGLDDLESEDDASGASEEEPWSLQDPDESAPTHLAQGRSVDVSPLEAAPTVLRARPSEPAVAADAAQALLDRELTFEHRLPEAAHAVGPSPLPRPASGLADEERVAGRTRPLPKVSEGASPAGLPSSPFDGGARPAMRMPAGGPAVSSSSLGARSPFETPHRHAVASWRRTVMRELTARFPVRIRGRTYGTPRWVVGVVAIGLAGVAVVGVHAWATSGWTEETIAALAQAESDGSPSSLEQAIARIAQEDDADARALHARLLATYVVEHGVERAAEAESVLSALEDDQRSRPDAILASALLGLARGDVARAEALLASPALRRRADDAETHRVRALVEQAAGRIDRALVEARAALALRPGSVRHATLHALLLARHGDAQAALAVLDGVPGGDAFASVRIARARILQESGRDPARAAAEASAVLGDAGRSSSAAQQAWAHMLLARASLELRDTGRAVQSAREALTRAPAHDAELLLGLADVFLAVGEPRAAARALERLHVAARETERAARLLAEVALANGDLDGAEQALASAGAGARADLLRARVAEARGRLDEARRLYESAASDPRERSRAVARLAALELAAGATDRAIERLEAARQSAQDDPEIVKLLVEARLATGALDAASEVVRSALAIRPGAPELLLSRARVELARGEARAALGTLGGLVASRPDDPDVHALLGEAARQTGERARAREGFERAIALSATHRGALVGLAELAVDEGDVTSAEAAIRRAEQAGARHEAARARARLLVQQGAGEQAIASIAPMAESGSDARLWTLLGAAQSQAERDREAEASFRRALLADPDHVDAHVGLAFVHVRMGNPQAASRAITAAERAARVRGATAAQEARILAARGRLRYEVASFAEARRFADEAIARDPRCAEAHLLRATLAIERGDDPVPHLRAAVQSPAPPAEAVGELVAQLPPGRERCRFAERYLAMAPQGFHADSAREAARGCR